jgi:hypothetical protein
VSRDDVERWFGGKMRVRVPLPHLPGATIAGARLSNLREHDAAYVVYQLPEAEQRGPDRRIGCSCSRTPERDPLRRRGPRWVYRAWLRGCWRFGGRVMSWSRTGRGRVADAGQSTPPPRPPEVAAARQRPMLPIPPRTRGGKLGALADAHPRPDRRGDTARAASAQPPAGHTVDDHRGPQQPRVRQRPPGAGAGVVLRRPERVPAGRQAEGRGVKSILVILGETRRASTLTAGQEPGRRLPS